MDAGRFLLALFLSSVLSLTLAAAGEQEAAHATEVEGACGDQPCGEPESSDTGACGGQPCGEPESSDTGACGGQPCGETEPSDTGACGGQPCGEPEPVDDAPVAAQQPPSGTEGPNRDTQDGDATTGEQDGGSTAEERTGDDTRVLQSVPDDAAGSRQPSDSRSSFPVTPVALGLAAVLLIGVWLVMRAGRGRT